MHRFVYKILVWLHRHQSHGAYLSSGGSFTGSHICPVCDRPLSTGLLAPFLLYFHFLHCSSIHSTSTRAAPSVYLVHFPGPRAGPLNDCRGGRALLPRIPPDLAPAFPSPVLQCITPAAVLTPLPRPSPTSTGRGCEHRCAPHESWSPVPNPALLHTCQGPPGPEGEVRVNRAPHIFAGIQINTGPEFMPPPAAAPTPLSCRFGGGSPVIGMVTLPPSLIPL